MDTYRSSEHFAPLLGYCDHQVQKVLHRDLKSAGYDVSPMQSRTLTFLHCQGGQTTQKALEQHLLVKPSTVNGIVERLEEKRLLTRSVSPGFKAGGTSWGSAWWTCQSACSSFV